MNRCLPVYTGMLLVPSVLLATVEPFPDLEPRFEFVSSLRPELAYSTRLPIRAHQFDLMFSTNPGGDDNRVVGPVAIVFATGAIERLQMFETDSDPALPMSQDRRAARYPHDRTRMAARPERDYGPSMDTAPRHTLVGPPLDTAGNVARVVDIEIADFVLDIGPHKEIVATPDGSAAAVAQRAPFDFADYVLDPSPRPDGADTATAIPLPANAVLQEVPTKYVWRPIRPVRDLIPGFHLGRWEGRIEGYVDRSRIETKNDNFRQRNENRLSEARLTLRNRGAFIIDPRLLRLTLGGTVGVTKEERDLRSGETTFKDTDDGDLRGYEFLAEVLPLNSFSVDVFANGNRLTQGGSLPGPLLTDVSNAGVTVSARRLYIPSTLSMRVDRAENVSGTARLVSTRRDERLYSITYDGRRGWINRALRLRYRFADKNDRFSPTTDYKRNDATAFYTQDFGTELNKRWDSRVRVSDRSGITEESRLDIDQLLKIDHTPRLSTQYRYFSTFTDRPVGDTDRQTVSFVIDHHLYESLRTLLELSDSIDESPSGERGRRRGRLEFDYRKQLPRDARLSANLGLFQERADDDLESTQVFVFEERHRFDETFALPITLNEPFVEPGSVSIIKTENGPDVPGCGDFSVPRRLVEEVDYTLRAIGDSTEIVPLPCSLNTTGINPGDSIRVDYIIVVDPSRSIETEGYAFNLSVENRNFRPFYRRTETNQDVISGRDLGLIDDRESEVFGLDMRYDTGDLRARLLLEHERFESRDQDYESDRVTPTLRYNYRRRWQLNLNGRVSETRFSRPRDRETKLRAIRAILAYVRDANLRIELFGEIRDLEDTLVPDEHLEELGLRVRWRFGKLDIFPTVKAVNLERGTTDVRDRRLVLRVIRRF